MAHLLDIGNLEPILVGYQKTFAIGGAPLAEIGKEVTQHGGIDIRLRAAPFHVSDSIYGGAKFLFLNRFHEVGDAIILESLQRIFVVSCREHHGSVVVDGIERVETHTVGESDVREDHVRCRVAAQPLVRLRDRLQGAVDVHLRIDVYEHLPQSVGIAELIFYNQCVHCLLRMGSVTIKVLFFSSTVGFRSDNRLYLSSRFFSPTPVDLTGEDSG